ncbi:thioredoxin fold domain-containing protein [Myroides marinus]|uniref:thioredoxin family protein n=1 Tax=Myroides marinus TaxID=703342 RepID=UPI00257636C1|nr:thioredoxin domain-containing protein [Myroides marinus]MDM1348928.1 thioredoxin fold domain-containing protein [Myroides marinus]MDM1352522.1 thioredoxin fold domain-containing protein [Myroides marinus]MDM1359727.1 thioredoxin fold domain-containing protein [Myroides marinus]MDM1366809.1 thioredoxin fold domain-containing protein [Myroides marinus]MDM1369191.1 thioredoxin fold domain-containing protein [Myroides marinus]
MNITEILNQAEKPVLLQFFAEWCGPCKMLTRIIDESVEEVTQHVELKRIDVDQEPALSAQFQIRAVPTMVLVNKAGEVLWKHTGIMEVSDIVTEISK